MAKWEEYCKQFGENLCHARAKAELTQERLATSVSEHLQKPVGRHAISDYEMGKRKRPPSDKMIDALMSALNITDRGVLVPYDESDRVQPFQIEATSYIETGNQNPEVIPYLGDYQCLFHSTDSASNYTNRGKLSLTGTKRSCSAHLELYNEAGACIKRYQGVFFLNSHFETCNILLCGGTFHEICMIIAPMAKPSIDINQFIFGLALTSAAGANKRPTAHRILFYRKTLSPEIESLIKSQLLLNTDMISLTAEQLTELRKYASSKAQERHGRANYYKLVERFCDIIERRGQKKTVYTIEESLLFDIKENGSLLERSQATAVIRTHALGEYYNKIGKAGQTLLLQLLEWEKKRGT